MTSHPISKTVFFAIAIIAWQESLGAVNLQVQVNPGTVAPGDAVLVELAVYNSIRFLDEVTQMETELGIVYSEAAAVVRSAIGVGNDESSVAPEALAQDGRTD